jgi:hypothetical protein
MTKAFLDSGGSLEARLEALRAAASLVEWPLPRERDPRVCAEYAGLLDKLLAMLAQGPGALDVALGEGLRALAACEGALKAGHSGNGDFSREELGIAASTAQKFERLARELETRPLLRAAVWAGEVTPRHAEAVLPVARGDDEAIWVERAGTGTVRALKQAVKDLAAADPSDPDDEGKWMPFRARMPAELRAVVDEAEELAGEIVGARSPRSERVGAICSEYLGTHPVDDGVAEAVLSPAERSDEPLKDYLEEQYEQWASLGRPSPVAAPVSEPAGVRAICDGLVRHARMRESWNEVFGHVAMVFCAIRGWEYLGFASFAHYCEERLGMGQRTVAQRVALERKLYELPALRKAMREGRVSYEKARLIARHATERTVDEWVEHAEGLTCVELQDALRDQEEAQMCARNQYRAWLPPSVAGLLLLTIVAVRKAEGRPLSPGECYAKACAHFVEVWKPILRARRKTPSKRVRKRDRWKCKVPVCSKAGAHSHHMQYRSAGGSDGDKNRIGLCAPHHLRGVHMGRVRIRHESPGRIRWELGVGEWGAPRRVFVRPAPWVDG